MLGVVSLLSLLRWRGRNPQEVRFDVTTPHTHGTRPLTINVTVARLANLPNEAAIVCRREAAGRAKGGFDIRTTCKTGDNCCKNVKADVNDEWKGVRVGAGWAVLGRDSVDQEEDTSGDEDELPFLPSLTMSQPDEGGPAGGGWKTGPLPQEKGVLPTAGGASPRQGWTKVSCACCMSEQIEPLVLVKLGPNVGPETKRWLIRLIGAPQIDGGETFGLVVHDLALNVVNVRRCTPRRRRSAGSPWGGRHGGHHRGLRPTLHAADGHRRAGALQGLLRWQHGGLLLQGQGQL